MDDPDTEKVSTLSNGDFHLKEQAILEACRRRDLAALRTLAQSPGGFLTDRIRREAWPILLGLSPPQASPNEDQDFSSWKELPRHKDEDQVQLDVNRAFIYYPNHKTEAQLAHQKALLSELIVSVLRINPYLCYFQGYHDICQVLLLVLPPNTAAPCMARLSALRIRDFMLPSLAPAVSQLRLIPDILHATDPALWHHLSGTEPFFALSGTLTMYAHDVTTLGEISRLFDVLLAREGVFTVYLFAAIVRSRRKELFETPADEPEMLHSILSKLPVPLDLEELISHARDLAQACPPESLPSWRGISNYSVLKSAAVTAKGPWGDVAGQNMELGKWLFDRQVRELRRAEARDKMREWVWQRRRPVGALSAAVLVGVAAVLLRRSGGGGESVLGGWLARWVVWWWR